MDITNFSRNDLENALIVSKESFVVANKEAINHIRKVIGGFIEDDSTLKGICYLDEHISTKNFYVKVDRENKSTYEIDFHFRKNYYTEYSKKPFLSMNFCSFGSFYTKDTDCRNYLIALGKFSEYMLALETKLCDYDWGNYYKIEEAYYTNKSMLDAYDNEVKRIEDDKKKLVFDKKLVVGSKIIIGKKVDYDKPRNTETGKYEYIPDVRVVEKVGKKTVNLSRMWTRLNKDTVFNYLLTKQWKFEGEE